MQIINSNKNLFTFPHDERDAIAITTNGMVKKDGKAVMGAGIARSARDAFPGIDERLGTKLRHEGNHAFWMGVLVYAGQYKDQKMAILTMPTKWDWREDADLALIERSAKELVQIADERGLREIFLPAPGCANGHLDWDTQVRPAIEKILDDRFTVVRAMGNGKFYK